MINNYISQKNVIVGGHYQWPSLPDEHSLLSTELIEIIFKQSNNINRYIFIDDIGASVMCISKCGLRKKVEKVEIKNDKFVENWITLNIENIEKSIIQNNDKQIKNFFKELLELINTNVIIEKFETIEIIHSFEKIIYTYNKKVMRPLCLSYILQTKLPKLILEKSINNLTSKQLHKLKKQNNSNLIIISKDNKLKFLTSNYISSNDILLREEIISNNKMIKASNKCSGLLSTLFNKIVKDNLKNEKTLTIFYIIPEDDKDRLENGIKSFITLYIEDYKTKYNLEEITLITCIIQDTYLLNIYKYNLKIDLFTHFIKRINYA